MGAMSFVCEKCQYPFTRRDNLNVHAQTCTGNNTNLRKCPKCFQEFKRPCDRARHEKACLVVPINNFGKESTRHVAPEFIDQTLRYINVDSAIFNLIKKIYEDPYNANIKPVSRDNAVKIFVDGEWNHARRRICIQTMVNVAASLLETHYKRDVQASREYANGKEIEEHLQSLQNGTSPYATKLARRLGDWLWSMPNA